MLYNLVFEVYEDFQIVFNEEREIVYMLDKHRHCETVLMRNSIKIKLGEKLVCISKNLHPRCFEALKLYSPSVQFLEL